MARIPPSTRTIPTGLLLSLLLLSGCQLELDRDLIEEQQNGDCPTGFVCTPHDSDGGANDDGSMDAQTWPPATNKDATTCLVDGGPAHADGGPQPYDGGLDGAPQPYDGGLDGGPRPVDSGPECNLDAVDCFPDAEPPLNQTDAGFDAGGGCVSYAIDGRWYELCSPNVDGGDASPEWSPDGCTWFLIQGRWVYGCLPDSATAPGHPDAGDGGDAGG